jgi:hypothetical protein
MTTVTTAMTAMGTTHLDGQHDDDRAPVEHVVDGGGGKGSPELLPLGHLGQRHDRVRHRRPDVGSHYHGHGHLGVEDDWMGERH